MNSAKIDLAKLLEIASRITTDYVSILDCIPKDYEYKNQDVLKYLKESCLLFTYFVASCVDEYNKEN